MTTSPADHAHAPSRAARALLAACGALGATGAPALAQTPVTIDGVSFIDRAQEGTIDLGALRGGLAVLDYDRDGWPDLLVGERPGRSSRLFRNVPDLFNPGARNYEDVTASSGLDEPDANARRQTGALAGDIDNDGDADLFMSGANTGDGTYGVLFRNNADGTFTNISVASGVRRTNGNAQSASFVDIDLDADLDLAIAHSSGVTPGFTLLLNDGAGTFTPAPAAWLPATFGPYGNVYAQSWFDFDLDGDQDGFLLTTGVGSATVLRNDAQPDGSRVLVSVAAATGFTFLGPAPMGLAAGDYDNDTDLDLGASNASVGVYYRNNGNATFTRVTPISTGFAWGTIWLDADNDGDLDHYQCGSYASGPNHDWLFRNDGAGAFTNISTAMNSTLSNSQYAVTLDRNNDGRQEIVSVNPEGANQYLAVYENTSTTPGRWLGVRLAGDGVRVSRDAVGARVLVTAGGVTRVREAVNGSSTASTEDQRLHFGLGDADGIDSITVVWPARGPVASRTVVYPGPFPLDAYIDLAAPCPADANADTSLDAFDFNAFVDAFNAGDLFRADLNADTSLDAFDFNAFVDAFNAGCAF